MEKQKTLKIMSGIDVEEVYENFIISNSALDESMELSRLRMERIETMVARREIQFRAE